MTVERLTRFLEKSTVNIFWKTLLVAPALLLLAESEASAQQLRVGVGIGNGYGYGNGFGSANRGYGGYGSGYGNGFGYPGYGGYGYGNGYGNRGFGSGGYGPGISIGIGGGSLGRSGSYGRDYSNGYYNNGYYGRSYENGYSAPSTTYATPAMNYQNSPSGYGYPTTSNPIFYQPSSNMTYAAPQMMNMPAMQADGTIIQASATQGTNPGFWNTMSTAVGPAKCEFVVPSDAEVWFDGKKNDQTGTKREFESTSLQPGMTTNLKVKIKSGENSREFTMPIRANEKSTMDLTSLVR